MTTSIKPRMSDAAVKAKTGKTWSEWFKLLDAAGAKKMTHQEIVALLNKKHGVGPWWQQMVTVSYEQARGLRKVHQKPAGFEISVSRTIGAPISRAYKAWTDDKIRKQWLAENLTFRKTTANKSLRIGWDGNTSLAVAFVPKGTGKCQVVAQHSKIPSAKAASTLKVFWSKTLDRLKEVLE